MSLRRTPRPRGFGILEAIVALTLLAGTGAALYAWLGTNLRAVSALAGASARAELQLRALELLETVNPAQKPQGELTVGQLRLQWRSEPAAPPRYSIPYAQGVRWQVGLFKTHVLARDADQASQVEFVITQIGLMDVSPGQPAADAPAP